MRFMESNTLYIYIFLHGSTALGGLGLLFFEVSRSHSDTPHSVDSPGRVIGPSQKPLPDNTQYSQDTDIYAPGGIQTRNLGKQTAADPRLGPHNLQDLHILY
jgi:hypothetical protein